MLTHIKNYYKILFYFKKKRKNTFKKHLKNKNNLTPKHSVFGSVLPLLFFFFLCLLFGNKIKLILYVLFFNNFNMLILK